MMSMSLSTKGLSPGIVNLQAGLVVEGDEKSRQKYINNNILKWHERKISSAYVLRVLQAAAPAYCYDSAGKTARQTDARSASDRQPLQVPYPSA